jgi:hypothetical protein
MNDGYAATWFLWMNKLMVAPGYAGQNPSFALKPLDHDPPLRGTDCTTDNCETIDT